MVGWVAGTMALSSPVGAHGPVEEFMLLPIFARCRATSPRQGAGSPIFDAVESLHEARGLRFIKTSEVT